MSEVVCTAALLLGGHEVPRDERRSGNPQIPSMTILKSVPQVTFSESVNQEQHVCVMSLRSLATLYSTSRGAQCTGINKEKVLAGLYGPSQCCQTLYRSRTSLGRAGLGTRTISTELTESSSISVSFCQANSRASLTVDCLFVAAIQLESA